MLLEHWMAGAVMVSLTLYALGGGADFGGGVWDLLASGPRAQRQRDLVAHAIGPIWEANHVWLVLVVVLMFVSFPPAWATISTALHVPMTLLLIGIVLRGSAFAFRSYGGEDDAGEQRWGRVFAVASVIAPLMLGACVAAVAKGAVQVRDGQVPGGFFAPWTTPFAAAVGGLALALFAFLGAVYLAREADDDYLREDFRRRAIAAGVVAGVFAFAALGLARGEAPLLWSGLTGKWWSLPFHAGTAAVAVGALLALFRRTYGVARVLAVTQVAMVLWGWALSQFPFVLPPSLTFEDAAAPPAVLRAVLGTLGAGALLLLPALGYLFRVFKSART